MVFMFKYYLNIHTHTPKKAVKIVIVCSNVSGKSSIQLPEKESFTTLLFSIYALSKLYSYLYIDILYARFLAK